MKAPLIILAALALCGCEEKSSYDPRDASKTPAIPNDGIDRVKIDGCWHVTWKLDVYGGESVSIVHAGDCDNPIHRHAEKE